MDTKKLRQKILDLAIRGKLVPQDPNDEPASVLLERIRAEKEQLIKEGKIKRSKKSAASDTSHYENVPFEVPENWEWVTLADISNYGECINVPVDKIPDNSWILELEDIEKDSGRLIQRRINSNRIINGVRHSFSKSNVLYSKLRTYLNKVLIADQDGYCTTEIMPITCKKGIMPEYLCHVLRSNYYVGYTTSLGYGVKMPRLGTNDALKSMIPVPPTSEQARIVSAIDRLSSTIDVLEVNQRDALDIATRIKTKILDLALTGKLVPQDPLDEPATRLLTRINPLYKSCDNRHYRQLPDSWEICQLKDIFDITMGQSPAGDTINGKSGIEFHQGKLNFTEKYLSESGQYTTAPSKVAVPESLLLCVRAPVGIVNITKREICIGRGLCSLCPKYDIDCLFWLYMLSTLKDYFDENATGSTFKAISGEIIRNATIPFPPVPEQKRILLKINELFYFLDKITAVL